MTNATTDARTVLESYLAALVAGDVDRIADSFTEDATWWLHGTLPLSGLRQGRAAILEFLTGAGSLYAPGTQRFTFGDITAEGDRAVLEWQVEGVATATGRPYANEYCAVFVTRGGRIAAVREYLDSLHAADTLYGSAG
jgi:uncharacterized protein (TIGR02246 family)